MISGLNEWIPIEEEEIIGETPNYYSNFINVFKSTDNLEQCSPSDYPYLLNPPKFPLKQRETETETNFWAIDLEHIFKGLNSNFFFFFFAFF